MIEIIIHTLSPIAGLIATVLVMWGMAAFFIYMYHKTGFDPFGVLAGVFILLGFTFILGAAVTVPEYGIQAINITVVKP